MIGSTGIFSGTGAFYFHDIDRVRPSFPSTFTLNVPPDGEPFFSIDCVPVDVRNRIFFTFKNPDADMYLSLEGTVEDKDDGEFRISLKDYSSNLIQRAPPILRFGYGKRRAGTLP